MTEAPPTPPLEAETDIQTERQSPKLVISSERVKQFRGKYPHIVTMREAMLSDLEQDESQFDASVVGKDVARANFKRYVDEIRSSPLTTIPSFEEMQEFFSQPTKSQEIPDEEVVDDTDLDERIVQFWKEYDDVKNAFTNVSVTIDPSVAEYVNSQFAQIDQLSELSLFTRENVARAEEKLATIRRKLDEHSGETQRKAEELKQDLQNRVQAVRTQLEAWKDKFDPDDYQSILEECVYLESEMNSAVLARLNYINLRLAHLETKVSQSINAMIEDIERAQRTFPEVLRDFLKETKNAKGKNIVEGVMNKIFGKNEKEHQEKLAHYLSFLLGLCTSYGLLHAGHVDAGLSFNFAVFSEVFSGLAQLTISRGMQERVEMLEYHPRAKKIFGSLAEKHTISSLMGRSREISKYVWSGIHGIAAGAVLHTGSTFIENAMNTSAHQHKEVASLTGKAHQEQPVQPQGDGGTSTGTGGETGEAGGIPPAETPTVGPLSEPVNINTMVSQTEVDFIGKLGHTDFPRASMNLLDHIDHAIAEINGIDLTRLAQNTTIELFNRTYAKEAIQALQSALHELPKNVQLYQIPMDWPAGKRYLVETALSGYVRTDPMYQGLQPINMEHIKAIIEYLNTLH